MRRGALLVDRALALVHLGPTVDTKYRQRVLALIHDALVDKVKRVAGRHWEEVYQDLWLTLDSVVYAIDGRPIEWRVAHCNLSGNHYLAEMS